MVIISLPVITRYQVGGADEKAGSGIMLGGSHQDVSEDHPSAFSLIASESASTPAT